MTMSEQKKKTDEERVSELIIMHPDWMHRTDHRIMIERMLTRIQSERAHAESGWQEARRLLDAGGLRP